ncbi:MAG: type I-F CRISPR-associated protein Csy2 [Gammaproteobacteria bacterium]|nr:type I-F CRISPR-associated protein Csy2 [Gammaproteobacteria bacterium]
MNNPDAVILLPCLQVQNANAVSGPLTWGFPSPTAFAGFIHAMQRKVADELALRFEGVGIVCHRFEPQVSRPAGKYTQVFNLTRNPLTKDGSTAAIVEEGRAHMEISLLIAIQGRIDSDEIEFVAQRLMQVAHTMRLAGGSLLPQRQGKRYEPQLLMLPQSEVERDAIFRKLKRRLLPGFALVQREDRLADHLGEMRATNANANALDALLDLARLNIEPDQPNPDKPEEKQWGIRRHPGWLVPIPVGYAAISALYQPGEVLNARDDGTPFRFVESLYSLGEWVSPHRLTSLQQLLWHHHSDIERGLYCCVNHYSNQPDTINNIV